MIRKLCCFILIIVLGVFSTACNNKIAIPKINTHKLDITAYELERETLNSFVVNCSIEDLEKCEKQELQYNKNKGYYFITEARSRFTVEQSVIDFIDDKEEITKYLTKNNIDAKVENTALIIAPHTPITLYAKTDDGNFFITINEDIEDDGYVYRLYTQDEFKEKFTLKIGSLTIKEKESTIKTKVYFKSADIPLVATLKALGAKVTEGSQPSKIMVGNATYYLDLENYNLYASSNKKQNLLYQIDGGRIFVYAENGDIMVDDATLSDILLEMGMYVEVIVDWQTANVSIRNR